MDDLKLLMGYLPDQKIYLSLKNKIIDLAYKKGLVDDKEPIKSGIWKFKNDWVVVSGKRAAIIQNNEFKFLEAPLINDRVIEYEKDEWIDLDLLKNELQNTNLTDAFEKLERVVSQWYWLDTSMTSFVTAFVMLQLFQTVMRWRPWLYLLGAAETGKSSFLEHVIERLYGRLVKRLDKSTAHATAQSIGNSGKVPVFDEFEKNRHLSEILELLKLCNRGGQKTSGTPGDRANEYSLHHMPWLASIYLPRTFATDRAQLSRVVKFELKRVQKAKALVGLTDAEATELLCKVVSAVISVWPKIEEKVVQIEKEKGKYIDLSKGKIDGRCVENLMYAMALISEVDGREATVPTWAINEVQDDGENILEVILMSKIRFSNDEFLVIDLIHKCLKEPLDLSVSEEIAKDLLRKNGLSVVNKATGWCLAIRCKSLSDSLLKTNEDYKGLDIKAPLERLEGAAKSVKTEWGGQVKQRALHIPGYHINRIANGGEEEGTESELLWN